MEIKEPVLVPIGGIRQKLDNDSPNYIFSPDLYLTLALAYDSMAAPDAYRGSDGVWQPDFRRMLPRLAVGWTEEANGDWTIELRRGVLSHSGNEWTSEDLKWSFERGVGQGVMASWRWSGVVGVKALEVLDRYRIRFHLRAPYPTFPNWLLSVSPNMLDSVAIRANAGNDDPWGLRWLENHVAGFGAYNLIQMDERHLRFAARASYWEGESEPYEVEVRSWSDRADAIKQLREKRPVVIIGTDPDETAALLTEGDHIVERTWAGHVSVEIDFTVPPFDDSRVRHALAFATPYEQIRSDGLLGLARPWVSPAKGVSQWYRDVPLPYRFDLAAARELLREGNLSDGLESDLFLDLQPSCERMADIVARSWKEVGISLNLRDIRELPEGVLPPLYLRTECAHNLSEPLYDLAHDYAAMNPLLPLPGGPTNVGNWRPRWKKNPAIIEQYVDVLLEARRSEKFTKFLQLQETIVAFGSSIFLAEVQQAIIANDRVPRSFISPSSRFFQAMEYQNATSRYLPHV